MEYLSLIYVVYAIAIVFFLIKWAFDCARWNETIRLYSVFGWSRCYDWESVKKEIDLIAEVY